MDIKTYLKRIDYDGSCVPSTETLRDLQLAHLLSVPFENLSVHAKEPIILEEEALFNKVVGRRRGGFCYELNGLFAGLLRALGFKVEMLSAGVARGDGSYGPEFDHMALMVLLDEPWLVDVGFGDSFREPLRLNEPSVQPQHGRAYQFVPDGENREKLILMEQKTGSGSHADGSEWKPQYRFTLQPYHYPDYVGMCHYHQTSPHSSFTKRRVCTLATPQGRITLSETHLITTTLNGERQEREIANENDYATLLSEHFGIIIY